MESLVTILLLLVIAFYVFRVINPKFDWNTETHERLLWYNDPFDSCKRKAVNLGRVK